MDVFPIFEPELEVIFLKQLPLLNKLGNLSWSKNVKKEKLFNKKTAFENWSKQARKINTEISNQIGVN